MLIYGAGGHAKVIISILRANGQEISCIYDDDVAKQTVSGLAVKGIYEVSAFPDKKMIIAIGNNRIRRKIAGLIHHPFGTVIHPSAIVDQSVKVGVGTCLMHRAVIQADSTIGNHVIINTSASVDHDCFIGNFVHLAPGVILAGNVKIGENCLIGIGSIVAPGLTIGKNCFVAAGSVITKNIPDGSTVRGNPARILTL